MLNEILKKNRNLLSLDNKEDINIIVEKVYLSSPTYSFINTLESTYTILNTISNHFSIPFKHIYVTGSAHIGFSLKTLKEFDNQTSDLDIAIIDTNLFEIILRGISNETNNFRRKHLFKDDNSFDKYILNTAKGVIHPRYFPNGEIKKNWYHFFHQLSIKNKVNYNKITACLFLSENSFKDKQKNDFSYFKNNMRITET